MGRTDQAGGDGKGPVVVSLDGLREARGARADQSANQALLREALRELDVLLRGGRTVVWDATALNRGQRSLVQRVARGRGALVTYAVMLVPEEVVARRNADRAYPVPDGVLASQLRRFAPPFPGEAHRIWYIGSEGTVLDTAGTLDGED
ncbi:hypothetical protein Aph01nite_73550 [Acrocarpospora phusangensis]|uniref:Uncharacterized protein n=1 Tax=Acrocarpospora phusangensis TaxID=1070424 RepID=A0A919UV44_9ACTN|nr:hypothetical protein Aph01nite_73550 [Acrocarpospora phusangensis]